MFNPLLEPKTGRLKEEEVDPIRKWVQTTARKFDLKHGRVRDVTAEELRPFDAPEWALKAFAQGHLSNLILADEKRSSF